MTQLTELPGRMQAGDPHSRAALFGSADSELHRLAHARPPRRARYGSRYRLSGARVVSAVRERRQSW